MIFPSYLGMSSSQLLLTQSLFRGVVFQRGCFTQPPTIEIHTVVHSINTPLITRIAIENDHKNSGFSQLENGGSFQFVM